MKILILADPSSPHTIKWINSLHQRGLEIFLFGLSKFDSTLYDKNITIESLQTPDKVKAKLDGSLLKAMYLAAFPRLKKVIRTFKPDILHTHYAASYGLIGSLSGFHPFINSIWGIDISIFPNVSFLHRNIIKYTFRSADVITSTSISLSREAQRYTDKNIIVIPFGINLNNFKPTNNSSLFKNSDIVIGTVKSLEQKYGIEYLINAFSILVKNFPELSLKLLIVGSGSMKDKLKELAKRLNVNTNSVFTGKVPHNKISDYHYMMDIEVYLSNFESFGVSIIEASACERPVVVSDVGGLPEVVEHNVTGIVVPPKNPELAAQAISKLICDKELRLRIGRAGKAKIRKQYDWNENVTQMINLYHSIIKDR
jgi:glycosyltransferase involved in cell wall biosynthesis